MDKNQFKFMNELKWLLLLAICKADFDYMPVSPDYMNATFVVYGAGRNNEDIYVIVDSENKCWSNIYHDWRMNAKNINDLFFAYSELARPEMSEKDLKKLLTVNKLETYCTYIVDSFPVDFGVNYGEFDECYAANYLLNDKNNERLTPHYNFLNIDGDYFDAMFGVNKDGVLTLYGCNSDTNKSIDFKRTSEAYQKAYLVSEFIVSALYCNKIDNDDICNFIKQIKGR